MWQILVNHVMVNVTHSFVLLTTTDHLLLITSDLVYTRFGKILRI